MAFADNFTGTASQLLSARTGWDFGFGDDTVSLDSTGSFLRKSAAGTATLNVWYREDADDSSTVQIAGADFLTNSGIGVGVLCSGASAATFNGYILRIASATTVRIYRINLGVLSASQLLNITTLTDKIGLEIRAQVIAGVPSFEVWKQGVLIGSTNDSSVDKVTTGKRALVLIGAGPFASGIIDNWQDNYAPPTGLAILENQTGMTWEAVRGTANVVIEGTYSGSPGPLEGRWTDSLGLPIPGFDWSVKVASPSGGTFTMTHTGLPIGGLYYPEVRASGNPGAVQRGVNGNQVGGVPWNWGQSQCSILQSGEPGGLSPNGHTKIYLMRIANKSNPGTPAILNCNTQASQIGSGIMAMANQIHLDYPGMPMMIVDCSYQGTSIEHWINDLQGGGETWPLWTGLANALFVAAKRQCSGITWFQGTADAGNYATYAGFMDTLKAKFLSELPGMNPLMIVMPHPRSNDGFQTHNLRKVQYDKSVSGSTWRFGGWALDHQMDGDISPHQKDGPTGNQRIGTVIGRAISRNLLNGSLASTGPVIVSARMNPARNQIKVIYDRDIETSSGVTTGIQGFFVSENNGSTYPLLSGAISAAITGAREVTISKDSGTWARSVNLDYLRGVPFSSDTGPTQASHFTGLEANKEADFFGKIIRDTTNFDGGRGMHAVPVQGLGVSCPVEIPLSLTITNGGDTLNATRSILCTK